MKLALVINALGIGGAERVLTTLASAWAIAGHSVAIITFEPAEAAPVFTLHESIKILRLNCPLSFRKPIRAIVKLPLLLLRLRRAVFAIKPDRVISFMDQANLLTLMALTGSGLNVTVAERCDPARSSLMDLPLPRWALRGIHRLRERLYMRAKQVVLQTERARDRFSSPLKERALVIPNPVAKPEKLIAGYGDQIIVALGRLVRQKRFDILISAFESLHVQFPEWKLIIFGNGPERVALQEQIEAKNLGEKILLPGAVKDSLEALHHGSIFVLSSESEGFPGALCEAMAYGLPVIATDCDFGPSEILTDEMDGILVPVNEPKMLAEALARLMKAPELRLALGTQAQKITSRLDLDKISKMWISEHPAQ